MLTTRITYPKEWVEFNAKYYCKCSNKFYRKNRDWFTMSPFNKKTRLESSKKILEGLKQKVRLCPKCNFEVRPVC
jgi:hypothetical protein